jgi:hypothetical protein
MASMELYVTVCSKIAANHFALLRRYTNAVRCMANSPLAVLLVKVPFCKACCPVDAVSGRYLMKVIVCRQAEAVEKEAFF